MSVQGNDILHHKAIDHWGDDFSGHQALFVLVHCKLERNNSLLSCLGKLYSSLRLFLVSIVVVINPTNL